MKTANIYHDAEDLIKVNNKLTIRKKKKKLKEEQRGVRKCSEDESAEEPASKKISTEDRKVGKESTGELFMTENLS